jgi:hypothetical protein
MESGQPLTVTRRALHVVAEVLLAGPQWAATREIALRVVPGGFATTAGSPVTYRDGAVTRDQTVVPVEGRSPRELLALLDLPEVSLEEVYADTSSSDLDAPLHLSETTAAWLVRCWEAGEAALRRFAPHQEPVLWPEHLDVAVTLDEVNYGVSPDDALIPVPYAYVGPWVVPPLDDFWTVPFGAVRTLGETVDSDVVLAFFEEGRRRLG